MSDESHDRRDRMTVAEAAKLLGISEGAVRKRVERGKLQAEHTPDGRLIVYLDTRTTGRDRVRDESHDPAAPDRYVRSLEDQVEYLRSQLADERAARTEERRRHDTVIAQLSAANAEMSRTIRAIEAPASRGEEFSPSEPPEATVAATEQPGRVGPQTEVEAAQEPAESPEMAADEQQGRGPLTHDEGPQEGAERPWWRRLFGGER